MESGVGTEVLEFGEISEHSEGSEKGEYMSSSVHDGYHGSRPYPDSQLGRSRHSDDRHTSLKDKNDSLGGREDGRDDIREDRREDRPRHRAEPRESGYERSHDQSRYYNERDAHRYEYPRSRDARSFDRRLYEEYPRRYHDESKRYESRARHPEYRSRDEEYYRSLEYQEYKRKEYYRSLQAYEHRDKREYIDSYEHRSTREYGDPHKFLDLGRDRGYADVDRARYHYPHRADDDIGKDREYYERKKYYEGGESREHTRNPVGEYLTSRQPDDRAIYKTVDYVDDHYRDPKYHDDTYRDDHDEEIKTRDESLTQLNSSKLKNTFVDIETDNDRDLHKRQRLDPPISTVPIIIPIVKQNQTSNLNSSTLSMTIEKSVINPEVREIPLNPYILGLRSLRIEEERLGFDISRVEFEIVKVARDIAKFENIFELAQLELIELD